MTSCSALYFCISGFCISSLTISNLIKILKIKKCCKDYPILWAAKEPKHHGLLLLTLVLYVRPPQAFPTNQPAASSGPAPAKHLSTGPLSDSCGIVCLLTAKCTLRGFTGWRAELLQGSDPTRAAWSTLERKEIMLFYTAHSACADFSILIGPDSTGAITVSCFREGSPCPPRSTRKLPPTLHSCPPAAPALLGNAGCFAVTVLNGTRGNPTTGLFLSFQLLFLGVFSPPCGT